MQQAGGTWERHTHEWDQLEDEGSHGNIILAQIGVTYKTGFVLEDWIYWRYTFTVRDYTQLQRYRYSAHCTLGFSVFTSRILAVDLSHSFCNFKSHMKPSFHSLIPFLPIFCSSQFRRLDSVQFFCSHAHIPADWRLETRLFASLYYCSMPPNTSLQPLCMDLTGNTFSCWSVFTAPLRRGPHRNWPLLLRRLYCGHVFTEPFVSNGHTSHNIKMYIREIQKTDVDRINWA
jgi:hypothetical protein